MSGSVFDLTDDEPTVTIEALRAHIGKTRRELNIRYVFPLVLLAGYQHGIAFPDKEAVYYPQVTSELRYCAALHELGHIEAWRARGNKRAPMLRD